MAELMNPYANPYLPAFVNQRPRINDIGGIKPIMNQLRYTQIDSVNGFGGAREFVQNNLAPGASGIVAEADPNTARIYICAKDSTGQIYVEGYRLIHEDEPKPVTMDDLNAKMSELLDRMNKLEEERNDDQSGGRSVWKNGPANAAASKHQPNGNRNGQSSVGPADGAKRPEDSANHAND